MDKTTNNTVEILVKDLNNTVEMLDKNLIGTNTININAKPEQKLEEEKIFNPGKAKTRAGRRNRWFWGGFLAVCITSFAVAGSYLIYRNQIRKESKNPAVETTKEVQKDKEEAQKNAQGNTNSQ
ncbi:hypothetical protein [Mesomycoplasma lagogenitalium]|uniref:Uncharacterized protein n=1 Tax=Mesomycoplasma lagogenitalium TaxID=171286 RepID=A0ABY8LTR8_9BACT|nr:hypothetical protein [Mesomycoplasma lagogenitalium]WGI36640.1 hypothetical protein QEG99_04215 [Mesomycoplasma lagogenitalium]